MGSGDIAGDGPSVFDCREIFGATGTGSKSHTRHRGSSCRVPRFRVVLTWLALEGARLAGEAESDGAPTLIR